MPELLTPEELEQAIEDTGGVPVVLGSGSTSGHFEVVDEIVTAESEVLIAAPTVVVATGILSGIEIDAAIQVDGTNYTIRDHRREGDGKMTRILLKKV